MALLTPTSPARAPNLFTATPASMGGDEFNNSGRELIVIEHTNLAGAQRTLSLTTQQTIDGEAIADKVVTVQPGERHLIGPFPRSIYNDGNGRVQMTYSSEGDLEVAIIKP